MRTKAKPSFRFLGQTEGAVSVEFALLVTALLLIVAGIMDFGHAYYMQQVITTASREGARYGTRYQTDSSGTRIAPTNLSPSIQNWITNQYQGLVGTCLDINVTGAISGTTGDDLKVTVNATKNWFLVHHFVPGMTDYSLLTGTTVMKCE